MKIWVGLGVICDNFITVGSFPRELPRLRIKTERPTSQAIYRCPTKQIASGRFGVLILLSPHSAETGLRKKLILRRKLAKLARERVMLTEKLFPVSDHIPQG